MRISVAAVGRLKTGAEKSLAADYFERTQGLCRKAGITKIAITELQESRAAEAKLRLADEGAALAAAVPPQAFRIVLDERGKAMTSEAFTDLIRKRQQEATADLAFLIGGPDGHSPQIRDSSNLLMAFGPATWPHRLVRIMLLEQIYRAVTIMVNHPYHRP
ncbi:MAG: 23S rRNA (pseudouridine(1915)-N(3))-methyltransferase RlmH [Rhizobiales bacterium]|nr:23S rRNA (pseudouridine(1915)-N(3))-methyltransferase RlmH [Hyphomicrobiales bacterium]